MVKLQSMDRRERPHRGPRFEWQAAERFGVSPASV